MRGGAARSFPTASDHYVRELDGLRAVAVACVVAAHYRLIPHVPGGFGVTLFFFLSGYLITTLFCAEHADTAAIDIPRFYLRRWLRLTPPLAISVVLAVALHPLTRTAVGGSPVPAGTTLAALLYYTNYYDLAWHMRDAAVIPFGICWSLAVEEHFYIGWPWIIRALIGRRRALCGLVVALCGLVLAWRCVAHYGLALSTDHIGIATDCRIDSILYGALLRLVLQTGWAPRALRVLRAPVTRWAALVALLLSFVIRSEGFRDTVRFTIQGIALMPCFMAVLSDAPQGWLRRWLASPPMVLGGRLSYSIYLFHLLARTPGEVVFGSPYRPAAILSGLGLTLLIAYGIHVGVERPMAGLRRRFRAQGGLHPAGMEPVSEPL